MQKEQNDLYSPANDNAKSIGKSGRIRGLWLFILILMVIPAATFFAAAGSIFIYRMYKTLPIHSQLQNIEQSLVSKVLDKDGRLIQ
jgi:membrane carboxypeptidase/penicillin-binding protein